MTHRNSPRPRNVVSEIPALGDAGPASSSIPVTFTRRQVEHLKTMFPEVVASPDVPIDQIRYRSGQRSVVLALERLIA